MHRETVVTLIGRPGCHLCDVARGVVSGVISDVRQEPSGSQIRLDERSILDDSALFDEHADTVPVVLVDGRVHGYWRIEPDEFRRDLRATVSSGLAREKDN